MAINLPGSWLIDISWNVVRQVVLERGETPWEQHCGCQPNWIHLRGSITYYPVVDDLASTTFPLDGPLWFVFPPLLRRFTPCLEMAWAGAAFDSTIEALDMDQLSYSGSGYVDLLSIGWSRVGKTHRSKAGVEITHALRRRSLRESRRSRNVRNSRCYRSRLSSGRSGSHRRSPQYVNLRQQDWIQELTGLRPAAISAQVILMVLMSDEGAVLLRVPGLKWRPAEEDVFETLWWSSKLKRKIVFKVLYAWARADGS